MTKDKMSWCVNKFSRSNSDFSTEGKISGDLKRWAYVTNEFLWPFLECESSLNVFSLFSKPNYHVVMSRIKWLIQFDAFLFWSHSLLWPFSNNFYFKAFGILFLGRITGSIRDRLDIRQYFLPPETFFVKVSKEKRWRSSLLLTPLTRSFFLNFCFLVDCTVIEAATTWLKESSSTWRLLTKEIKRKSLYLSVERKKERRSKQKAIFRVQAQKEAISKSTVMNEPMKIDRAES